MARNRQVRSRPHSSTSTSNGSSAARVAANRANAQRSTGPRTPEGKARVSQNAITHGLCSEGVLVAMHGKEPAEAREAYENVLIGMYESYQPTCFEEEQIVDQLAAMWWRLRYVNAAWERKVRHMTILLTNPIEVVSPLAVEQARIERSMSRLRRDFEFLRRWKVCRPRTQDLAEPLTPGVPVPEPSPAPVAERDPEPELQPETPTVESGEGDSESDEQTQPLLSDQDDTEEFEEQSQPLGEQLRLVEESIWREIKARR
jgi:hypothetical protein